MVEYAEDAKYDHQHERPNGCPDSEQPNETKD